MAIIAEIKAVRRYPGSTIFKKGYARGPFFFFSEDLLDFFDIPDEALKLIVCIHDTPHPEAHKINNIYMGGSCSFKAKIGNKVTLIYSDLYTFLKPHIDKYVSIDYMTSR